MVQTNTGSIRLGSCPAQWACSQCSVSKLLRFMSGFCICPAIQAPKEDMQTVIRARVPFPLRFLFASQPKVMGKVLGIVYRAIATHLTHKAGYTKSTAHTGPSHWFNDFWGGS
jgi:hypothetical protein